MNTRVYFKHVFSLKINDFSAFSPLQAAISENSVFRPMDQKGGLKYKNPDFVLDFWFGAEWFRRIVGHSKMKSGSFQN